MEQEIKFEQLKENIKKCNYCKEKLGFEPHPIFWGKQNSKIVFYAKTERYIGFGPTIALVTGILSLLAGLMLLMYPNAGELIMTLLLPIWFIAHSVSRLTHIPLVRLAGKFYYYFTLIVNILGITLGCLMIIWPWVALFSTGFIIGGYLILLGIDCVVMACSDMDAGWM